MTLQQFQGLMAFAVRNNKTAIVSKLNQLGYSTPLNISDEELYDKILDIFSTYGLDEINAIFTGVPIDYSKTTPEEVRQMYINITGQTPSVQKGQTTQTFLDDIQKFLFGQKVETGSTSTTTSSPALSPLAVVGIAVASIVVIIIIILSPRLAK